MAKKKLADLESFQYAAADRSDGEKAAAGRFALSKIDPADKPFSSGDKERDKQTVADLATELDGLQEMLYADRRYKLLVVLQGTDASGKDGTIRGVFSQMSALGVHTVSWKAPSDEERAHDYLWRVHRAVPRYGNIGAFNRSHYEAVVAERVLKLVTAKTCEQRYEQIVAWERMLVENRVVLLKFFLHLSREEQAERLQERIDIPKKRWKFSPGDLVVRKQWKTYHQAYEDAINATSHSAAPWHIVPADRNWYRDFVVADTVVKAMEALKLKWPKPKSDLSGIRIK